MYIYVLHQKATNLFKIGQSARPFKRKSSLQTGNPDELDLLLSVKSAVPDKEIHEFFEGRHERGEWFRFDTPEEAIHEVMFYLKYPDPITRLLKRRAEIDVRATLGPGDASVHELKTWLVNWMKELAEKPVYECTFANGWELLITGRANTDNFVLEGEIIEDVRSFRYPPPQWRLMASNFYGDLVVREIYNMDFGAVNWPVEGRNPNQLTGDDIEVLKTWFRLAAKCDEVHQKWRAKHFPPPDEKS